MANRRHVAMAEINSRININDPYTYLANVTLTSNSDSQSVDITIGNEDFYATDVFVRALDDAGKDITNSDKMDEILFTIKSEDGNDYVHSNGFPIKNLNDMVRSPRFRGWLFSQRQKYTVKVFAGTIPQSPAMSANYNVQITFSGYRLSNTLNN